MITRRALLSLLLLAAPLAAATCDSLTALKLPDTTITSAKTVAAGAFTLADRRTGFAVRFLILQEAARFLPRRRSDSTNT